MPEDHDLLPKIRDDIIDIIIISRRGAPAIAHLFKETSLDPSKWLRHRFVIVTSDTSTKEEIDAWLLEARETHTFSECTTLVATSGNERNSNAMRQQAVEKTSNKFVYFQDDNAPLPKGLDRRMKMMQSSSWYALFGITETIDINGNPVEDFSHLLKFSL